MRPILRGKSPLVKDFDDYADAKPYLVSNMGNYCSFCERRIVTNLAVEHIQAKSIADFAHLAGRWENFLLACVNCNSTKSTKRVEPLNYLLPDRDNTFAAFSYMKDGKIEPSVKAVLLGLGKEADATLALVGLDKPISAFKDENGKEVALDRVSQRLEAWATATEAKNEIDGNPGNGPLEKMVIKLACATGFFSIWMTVFQGYTGIRSKLVDAFNGTRGSGCFCPLTSDVICPSPNPSKLLDGAKI